MNARVADRKEWILKSSELLGESEWERETDWMGTGREKIIVEEDLLKMECQWNV